MCDPISAIVGLASVASSVMGGMAQSRAVEEQNRLQQEAMARSRAMRQEEYARQDAMRKENAATLQKTTENFDPAKRDQDLKTTQEDRVEQAAKFGDEVAALTPDAAAIPGSNQGNTVVSGDLAKRLAIASQDARKRIQAFAKLGGYDEQFQKNALATEGNNRQINLVNNLRQGSLATTNAGVGLINSNVGKAAPADMTGATIVGGLGNMLAGAAKGGIFG